MIRFRRFVNNADGAAAVEFALIGIPLVLLLLGLIEFGRALHIRSAMDNVVDRAQRMILIDSAVSTTRLTSRMKEYFLAGDPEGLVIHVSDNSQSGVDYRLVRVSYDMRLLLPMPLGQDITLTIDRKIAIHP